LQACRRAIAWVLARCTIAELEAIGVKRPADFFEFERDDPGLARKIQHRYRVHDLAVLG